MPFAPFVRMRSCGVYLTYDHTSLNSASFTTYILASAKSHPKGWGLDFFVILRRISRKRKNNLRSEVPQCTHLWRDSKYVTVSGKRHLLCKGAYYCWWLEKQWTKHYQLVFGFELMTNLLRMPHNVIHCPAHVWIHRTRVASMRYILNIYHNTHRQKRVNKTILNATRRIKKTVKKFEQYIVIFC